MRNSQPVNRAFRVVSWVLFGLGATLIIVFAATPGGISSQESGIFSSFVKSVLNFFSPGMINESNEDLFHAVLRKLVGHFGLFGFTGFFGYFAFSSTLVHPRNAFWFHLLEDLSAGLLLGFGSEAIQLIPGLSPKRRVRGRWTRSVRLSLGAFACRFYLVSRRKCQKEEANGGMKSSSRLRTLL